MRVLNVFLTVQPHLADMLDCIIQLPSLDNFVTVLLCFFYKCVSVLH